jgi:hypothetical protein
VRREHSEAEYGCGYHDGYTDGQADAEAARSLADRMRAAATTLREASALYDAFDPDEFPWTPSGLLREADHVEQDTL